MPRSGGRGVEGKRKNGASGQDFFNRLYKLNSSFETGVV